MTKPTVTLPDAVSAINSLIADYQRDGSVPEFSYEMSLPSPEYVAAHLVYFPQYHMEFCKEFGNRVSLSFRPAFKPFNRPAEFSITTSGNGRTIEQSQALAKALAGVAALATDIRKYLDGIDLVPTEEAKAFVAQEDAQRQATQKANQEAALAAEKAKLSLRGQKAAAQRKLNALAGVIEYKQFHALQKLVNEGKFDEFKTQWTKLSDLHDLLKK